MNNNKWFILKYKYNQHEIALRNLERQNFKTFFPCEMSSSSKAKKRRPLFPGYMFIYLNLETSPWSKVNRTLGVSYLIQFSGTPPELPEKLVFEIMEYCDSKNKLSTGCNLEIGKKVKFVSGAFRNQIAAIEKIEADKRIWVIMDLMGRQTRLQVSSTSVKQIF